MTAGRWHLEADAAFYDGKRLPVTPSEAVVLHTVAAANGGIVKAEAIGNRCSYAERPENTVRVHICHLRKKLPAMPILAVRRHGYRWIGD